MIVTPTLQSIHALETIIVAKPRKNKVRGGNFRSINLLKGLEI